MCSFSLPQLLRGGKSHFLLIYFFVDGLSFSMYFSTNISSLYRCKCLDNILSTYGPL